MLLGKQRFDHQLLHTDQIIHICNVIKYNLFELSNAKQSYDQFVANILLYLLSYKELRNATLFIAAFS